MVIIFCRAIERANCYHREGQGAPCCAAGAGGSSEAYYMLLFGVAQVALSQIPDFHSMAWLSVFAAVMSFFYSFIGFGLGAAKVIGAETIAQRSRHTRVRTTRLAKGKGF